MALSGAVLPAAARPVDAESAQSGSLKKVRVWRRPATVFATV